MHWRVFLIIVLIAGLAGGSQALSAEGKRSVVFDNFDSMRTIRSDSTEIWYGYGNVHIRIDSTHIICDSVIWYVHRDLIEFFDQVEVYDSSRHIEADKVSFFQRDSLFLAEGNVIMVNRLDSIRTESQKAEFDQADEILYLEGEPILFLNYPDTADLLTINGDYLTFFSELKYGEAEDSVIIEHRDTRAKCRCAEFFMDENRLTLIGNPLAEQGESEITGQEMEILFSEGDIDRIDVFEDAQAFFHEESDSSSSEFSGESHLIGKDISFIFVDDEIRKIEANGAARSEYYPAADDTTGAGKNIVSGDSIFIYVKNRKSNKIEIKGGAEGVYITEKTSPEPLPGDSLSLADTTDFASVPDSIMVVDDTLMAGIDSTMVNDSLPSTVPEDSIHYQGEYLEFFVANRVIRISGNSVVRQEAVILHADTIDYNIRQRVVLAQARADSIGDSTVIRPLSLKDGSEEIFGSRLVFNVDTKRGLVEDATTQYERAYYTGEDIYKEEEKIFYVDDGTLSSCNLDEPHFHFQSQRMKLIHNEKAVARPVILYIETLPVMYIPYYVFPLKRGRHSGILPIKLGNFEQGNRYLGNLGYYWAASEYWDMQAALDYFENSGWNLSGQFRYNKRYGYTGSVRGTFARNRQESYNQESKSDKWTLSGNHSQTLPYDIKFSANGTYVSSKDYYTEYSTDQDERLNRNIISKANFSKKFGRSSLALSFNHTNNLDTDSKNSKLPSGRFSVKSFQPFGSGREVDGKTIKKWYNQIYVSYRNSFSVYFDRKNLGDTAATLKEYAYLDHSMSLTASQKILQYFSISPRVSFTETWYAVRETDQSQAAGVPEDFYRRGSVTGSIGLNTKLYGTFPINLFGLMALRHVLTPTVGFSMTPAITKNDPVKIYVGMGGGSGNKRRSMSFGLSQLFQARVKRGEEDKKIDLLNLNSSTGYNFEATGRKFSDLTTTMSTSLSKINLSGNMRHDLYDDEDQLQLLSPRMESFSVASSFQLRGSVADDYVRQGLSGDTEADSLEADTESPLNHDITKPQSSSSSTNWNLNVSHRYSESGLLTGSVQRTHWAKITFNVDLTDNWKIKYQQNYDFIHHRSTEKVIDIMRKLHCWEGHFYWIPDGSRQGFYFKLSVVAIPDIKLEKSESGLRGALFNR
ncbi:MAG: hypothetical protein GY841_02250 [FCB group bacterium]|nr:hypothetical protein [FCB group bacterium]